MIDKIKVRKAIAAFHKNNERITLSKLARTTGHSYANLYASREFRRFAKKRVRVPKATATTEPIVPSNLAEEPQVVEPQAAVATTPVSEEPQIEQAPEATPETPRTSTLNIQIGDWLTLRLTTPVPEGMRRWVNSTLATAQAFMETNLPFEQLPPVRLRERYLV